ncbi:hypothetical protein ACIBEJ_48825 [Nonomuraea sp. NPDC050790]|uniref:hypothetical protein n=1 Tax=Nonomuraea sp. NPDC050790 TaxID=3364371 RepID=UPI0037B3CB39
MTNKDAEQPGDDILLIPVFTIEVRPDRWGWLRYAQAEKAAAGRSASLREPAALMVRREISGCDQMAAMVLASVLCNATSVTIYGRGPGMAQLTRSLRQAIAHERAWRNPSGASR